MHNSSFHVEIIIYYLNWSYFERILEGADNRVRGSALQTALPEESEGEPWGFSLLGNSEVATTWDYFLKSHLPNILKSK